MPNGHFIKTSNNSLFPESVVNIAETLAAQGTETDLLAYELATIAVNDLTGDQTLTTIPWVSGIAADVTAEAATITESDPALNQHEIRTRKIAALFNASSESLDAGGASLNTALSGALQRSIFRSANQWTLVDTTAGLFNTVGVGEAQSIDDNLDSLINAISTVRAGGFVPTHLTLHPQDWAYIIRIKDQQDSARSLVASDPLTAFTDLNLLGLKIVQSDLAPRGTGLITSKADVVSVMGSLHVAESEHALFNADAVTVRGTLRLGTKILNPTKSAKLIGIGAGSI